MRREEWMPRTLKILAATWLAVLPGLPARAQQQEAAIAERLVPGMGKNTAESALRSLGAQELQVFAQEEPQALRRGLVEDKLLETLNRFSLAPSRPEGGLAESGFRIFLTARLGDRSICVTFGEGSVAKGAKTAAGGLRFVLIRIPVPVDKSADPKDGWSRARLHRLREALSALQAFRLEKAETDRYGNTLVWRGKNPKGTTALVWYLPAQDELRLLLH